MGNWGYSEEAYQESKVTVPAGKHRVRIALITPKISKTGNRMYEIMFDVSGYTFRLFDYLVFNEQNSQQTNGKIGSIVHSFGVKADQLDPEKTPIGWVHAVGACVVKLDEESRSKISYYIEKEKAIDLPPWKEVERKPVYTADDAHAVISNAPDPIPPPEQSFVPPADLPFDFPV